MNWDYYLFIFGVLFIFSLEQLLIIKLYKSLKKSIRQDFRLSNFIRNASVIMLVLVIVVLGIGWVYTGNEEQNKKKQLRGTLDGIAPLLTYELKKMDHKTITLETPVDDPHYLALINTMVGWMKLNPQIMSIYTFRKLPDGSVVFILGPETDYNRDGVIEGSLEERVPIGTKYTDVIPEIEAAFSGRYTFQETPNSDVWGSSISGFMPIYGDSKDTPEAVLGVDFNSANWNAAVAESRMEAIGLVTGFLVMADACYLLICFGWIDKKRIRQQKFLEETARLDRLNLIGEMAASIGHEIRNPLTTVRGYLQYMKKGEQNPSRIEKFDLAIDELDQANAIITEFLSLAKNKALDFRAVNLNSILLKIFPLIQADAVKDGHEIVLNTGEIKNLLLDEKEIRQLVLNLVRNSLESMPHKGVVIISTYEEKDRTVLTISDTGCGIPPSVLPKLGTPFVTTKIDGYGLGLAVCYRIAQRHAAEIDVQTGSNGTKFLIKFANKDLIPQNEVS